MRAPAWHRCHVEIGTETILEAWTFAHCVLVLCGLMREYIGKEHVTEENYLGPLRQPLACKASRLYSACSRFWFTSAAVRLNIGRRLWNATHPDCVSRLSSGITSKHAVECATLSSSCNSDADCSGAHCAVRRAPQGHHDLKAIVVVRCLRAEQYNSKRFRLGKNCVGRFTASGRQRQTAVRILCRSKVQPNPRLA